MSLLLQPRWALLLVAAVYVGTLAMLPLQGFWVVDNGSKYLQVQAALNSGGRSVAIPWPGRAIDPALELNPIPFPYSIVRDGEIHFVTPPAFALVSAAPFRLLGFTGLYLLPLASGLALLAGASSLGRHLGLGPEARAGAILLAGLATPVWFYSVSFWEHAVAASLGVGALATCFAYAASHREGAPRDAWLLASGALAAFGVWFRTDLYLLLPVLLLVLVVQLPRERRIGAAVRFAAAATAALVPLWLLNTHWTGTPMGLHGTSVFAYEEGLLGHLRGRGVVLHNLFAASHWQRGLSLLLALPYLVLLAASPVLDPARFRRALPVVAGLASLSFAVTLTGYATSPHGPLWQVLHANGLFAVAPVLALAFLGSRGSASGDREHRWLRRMVLGYGLLYALTAPVLSTAGVHWGSRFLLLLYPILALLAASALADWQHRGGPVSVVGAIVLATAILLSVGSQVYSVLLLQRAQGFSDRLNTAVESRPDRVVVSRGWRTGQELARVFDRRQIFFLRDDEDWSRLRERLRAAGVEQVLWVESAYERGDQRPMAKGELVGDDGLGLYAVRLLPVRP